MQRTALNKLGPNMPDERALARLLYLVDVYEGHRERPETPAALEEKLDTLTTLGYTVREGQFRVFNSSWFGATQETRT